MNITINNQQFEKTSDVRPGDGAWYNGSWYKPVPKFKEGDWVIFWSEAAQENHISRIKEWRSSNWCRLESGAEPFKHLLRKASHNDIWVYLQKVAKEKGLIKGAKVYKDWDKGSFVTIVQEHNDYYSETDEFAKSGIVLYRKGKWIEKVDPLFKTEDGVDVYLNQNTYGVNSKMTLSGCYNWFKKEHFIKDSLQSNNKYFSTLEKAEEYINKNKPKYEILSFKSSVISYTFRFKNKYGLFPLGNSYNPESRLNEFSEKELLDDTWYEIHSVKRISDGEIFTLEDECISTDNKIFKIEEFLIDDLTKSGISVVFNRGVCGGFKNVCLSFINKHLPKFTFGGYECSFKVISSGERYHFKTVEITCKGETGTHWQIEKILKNYFRPCKFGNVEVKQFTLKNMKMNLNSQLVIETNKECYDINNVDEIQIGCLVGKYSQLVDIYNHCLNLLK